MDGVLQVIIESLAITFAPDFIMKNYPPVIKGEIILIDLVIHKLLHISFRLIQKENPLLFCYQPST